MRSRASEVEAEVQALSQSERRRLRSLGVRIGTFSLFLPEQLAPESRGFAAAFAISAAPARANGLSGRIALGSIIEGVETLERLGELLRGSAGSGGTVTLTDACREVLGWSSEHAQAVMRGLGYVPVGKVSPDSPRAWRRRRSARVEAPDAPALSASPFAALANLQPPRRMAKRRPARRKARRGDGLTTRAGSMSGCGEQGSSRRGPWRPRSSIPAVFR